MLPSLVPRSSQRLVMTLWPVSAAKVSGWTNRVAASVITTCTSKPLPLQGAHQFCRFVRSDAAGDADRDSHGSIVDRSIAKAQCSHDQGNRAGICKRRATLTLQRDRTMVRSIPEMQRVARMAAHVQASRQNELPRARGSECRLPPRAALRPACLS